MYSVVLSQFEGPLDLLLHLITAAKIDIKDIFVSDITDQYLAYMDQMESLDMDAASEFLAMAATLIEIKSNALLPRPPKIDPEEESPEEELVRRLTEYKMFKEAGERFKVLENEARGLLSKLPDEVAPPEYEPDLTGITAYSLWNAFSELLNRAKNAAEEPPARQIRREVYSVHECMFRIQKALARQGMVVFTQLFSEYPSKEEVVSVFFALLELMRLERVDVIQEETYGEISILSKPKVGVRS